MKRNNKIWVMFSPFECLKIPFQIQFFNIETNSNQVIPFQVLLPTIPKSKHNPTLYDYCWCKVN